MSTIWSLVSKFFLKPKKIENSILTSEQQQQCSNNNDNICSDQNFVQFFVRMISGGKTLVFQASPHDKILSIHIRIQSVTGIPVPEQRLIYGNKQLLLEQSLSECMITNDSGLQLVGRIRSNRHPETWRLVDDLISTIFRLCKGEKGVPSDLLKRKLTEFVKMVPCVGHVSFHLHVFVSAGVPEALAMLYMSPGCKECSVDSVQSFINNITGILPQPVYLHFVRIVLNLCRLLRRAAGNDDPLYKSCRSSLAVMVKDGKSFRIGSGDNRVVGRIFDALLMSMDVDASVAFLPSHVDDFVALLGSLKAAVKDRWVLPTPIPPSCKLVYQTNQINFLFFVFNDFVTILLMCLDTMEDLVKEKKANVGCKQYLVMLKELNDISKLFEGAEDYIWTNLRHSKLALFHLIFRYAKRGKDYEWILKHKDYINSESRRRLVFLLLPEVDDEEDDNNEMIIDRSQLLVESFKYISEAEPDCLRTRFYMEFKDEEATGLGVLREWFFLVSQEIFDPNYSLFVTCPNDLRRFFPNHASKVNPMHLEYFSFAGRIIALALMHNIQVGIAFDRSFFLQLAGVNVSLEDIKDADPYLYRSCQKILDMDPTEIDEDALGLTFIWEIQESGSMKATELCPGGKDMMVNSRNRKEYVDLLIHHLFETSVSEQITHFSKGFTDIVGEKRIQKMCFTILELEDFDAMLHGSESAISVEDWKAHTVYTGYQETDSQIHWFWKIVGELTAKQQKVLLFFWTSIKYLPVEGFGGLDSKLSIYNSYESIDHLPSSQTCMYQLCLPAYPSMSVMQMCLNFITQDYVGYSFGAS